MHKRVCVCADEMQLMPADLSKMMKYMCLFLYIYTCIYMYLYVYVYVCAHP